ncbi:MAG: aspartate/glutamate racemase family protein [Zestosphaera sp.]
MTQPKILVLNPVNTDIWNELTLTYVKKVVSPEVEVFVRSLSRGPPAIESEYDKDLAAPYVIDEVLKAAEEGFHAVIINCFDDPGLRASREVSKILVLGIGETSLTVATLLGYRIAVISTGSRYSRTAYYRKAIELGIEKRVVYASGIDVRVLDLRKDLNMVKKAILDEAKKAINDFGAEVIVLGCGGLIGLSEELSELLGVPVIDPTLITVKVAEVLIKLKLRHYTYTSPYS